MSKTTIPKEEWSQILQGARDFLAQPGRWIKGAWRRGGRYGSENIQCCAEGAIRHAATCAGYTYRDTKPLERLVAKTYSKTHTNPYVYRPMDFNDSNKTRLEDVLKTFDDTIEGLKDDCDSEK